VRAVVIVAVLATAGTAAAQEQELAAGDRAFDRGQLVKAARAYDRAIREFPGQVPAEAYGKRAAIFILARDYAAGLRFIDQIASAQHPNAAAVLEQRALILWALNRRADAVAVAEKVAAKQPKTFAVQQLIGQYYSQSNPKRAVRALRSYFAHRPRELADDDALPRLRLGFALLALADPAAATVQFDLVLSRFRSDRIARVNATNGLCAAHTAASRYDAAIAICSRITSRLADVDARASVWYNLARAYLGKRRHGDARRAARRYLRARPKQGKGYLLIGDTFLGERKPKQALRQFLEAEKRPLSSPERAQLGIRLGLTYRRLGQITKALGKLDQALARDPTNPELRLELGAALLSAAAAERSKTKRAAFDRRAAQVAALGFRSASKTQLLELRVVAARAEYNLGRLERSEAHYRAALAQAPRSARVRVGLTQAINRRAAVAFAAGKRERAAELSRAALEVSPRSPTAHRNLAVLMIAQGKCAAAAPHVAAIAKVRSQAMAYHRLGGRVALCTKDRAAAPRPLRGRRGHRDAARCSRQSSARCYLHRLGPGPRLGGQRRRQARAGGSVRRAPRRVAQSRVEKSSRRALPARLASPRGAKNRGSGRLRSGPARRDGSAWARGLGDRAFARPGPPRERSAHRRRRFSRAREAR